MTEVLQPQGEVAAALAGRPLAELLHPADPSHSRALLERLRRERVVTDLTLVVGDSRALVAAAAQDATGFLVIAAESDDALRRPDLTLPEGPAAKRLTRVLARSSMDDPPLRQLGLLHAELKRNERLLARKYARLRRESRNHDRILQMAAHDLRGPLGAILASVEFLARKLGDRLGQEERLVLARIRRCADAMALLAHELVDVPSLGEGRPKITCAPVQLPALLKEAVEMRRLIANDAAVQVELVVEGELPILQGDGARLARVLENLLSNAFDHTPAGGHVVLRARHRPPIVEIEVADEGAGIDPAALTRLFRPFTPRGGKRYRGESHGLGLAIVHALVESHGGSVHAENRPKGGALFRVLLPVEGERRSTGRVEERLRGEFIGLAGARRSSR